MLLCYFKVKMTFVDVNFRIVLSSNVRMHCVLSWEIFNTELVLFMSKYERKIKYIVFGSNTLPCVLFCNCSIVFTWLNSTAFITLVQNIDFSNY